jgi:uncharacterized membrane protein
MVATPNKIFTTPIRPAPSMTIRGEPMIFTGREAHTRSLVKAISWRIAGSIDTFVISFIITGHIALASSIAGTELITKVLLYYFHERIWAIIPWGRSAKL